LAILSGIVSKVHSPTYSRWSITSLGPLAVALTACRGTASEPAVRTSTADDSQPPAAKRPRPPATVPMPTRVVGETGALFLRDEARRLPSMSWEEYAALSERGGDVPWLEARPVLPDSARFGLDIVVDGRNLSFAVVPTAPDRAELWIDHDADGSLADEQAWTLELRFGEHLLGEGGRSFPVEVRLVQDGRGPGVELRSSHQRLGVLELPDRRVHFSVQGSSANFQGAGRSVLIDLDDDVAWELDPLSDERFDLSDPDAYVTFGDTHWSIEVDPRGDTLTLSRRDDVDGPRPRVALGEVAPDFEYEHAGHVRHLRDADRPVVLEFFSASCSFCAEAGPALREAFPRLQAARVDVISIEIDGGDGGEAFARQHGKTWPLVLGEAGQRIARRYRVQSTPTFVLVDGEGRMIERGNWKQLGPRIGSGRPFDPLSETTP